MLRRLRRGLSSYFFGLHVEEDEEDREEFASEYRFSGIHGGLTFNIALIGDTGSGKSSFVNTIRG